LKRKRTIVIGGGLAGLAAATRLMDTGHQVTVLEAAKYGGGRSRSFHDPVLDREIDNGQHLMMGCYHETQSFLRTIGTEDDAVYYQRNLAVKMVKPGGVLVDFSCPALPAPFHLAAGLVGMRGVGIWAKATALRAGLMLRNEVVRPDDSETCDAWLQRMGQTPELRSAFWEPLIWAVLNEDPLVASAAMLVAVLDRAFMSTRDASRLGVPRRPLSRLYVDHACEFLRRKGATLEFGAAVREIRMSAGRAVGVRLKDGRTLDADNLISAIPPHALLAILPGHATQHWAFVDVQRLGTSPIINLWALVDRPVFDGPFVGLVGSPLHWIFDRDQIEPSPKSEGHLLSVTISGARSYVDDSPSALEGLFESELRRYFPRRPFELRKFRVVKERRATISHAAGTYHRRPETKSPVPGLLLAGDWTRTGLPATIESAVKSGHDAAAVILDHHP
jgi:squalene-associated FAD-dependent desaturase